MKKLGKLNLRLLKMRNKLGLGNRKFSLIIYIYLIILMSISVIAIPNSINIQGKLTNPSDTIQTGTFNFTFRIYDNFTSGNKLYESANVTSTTDARGVYDIILQNVNISFDKQLYLGIEVNVDGEMTPRINLTSVPYTFRANTSDSLDANRSYTVLGLNVTENLTLGQKLTFSLRESIDNLVDGFLRVTGSLNVTESLIILGGVNVTGDLSINQEINLTALGNIDASGTISADTLSAISTLNVGGGFNAGGLTIQSDGDIVTVGDILFSGNITIVNVSVTNFNVNGSVTPGIDNTFDLGNESFRWRSIYAVGMNLTSNNLELVGNLTVDTGTLFVDSGNDKVGIGKTNPATELDVAGGINASTLNISGNVNLAYNSGNVGIGTTSPNFKLDVAGPINASGLNITGNALIKGDLNVTGTSYLGDITINADNITTNNIVSRDGNISFFNDSGDELMRITSLGRVGIGVTDPDSTLEVKSNVDNSASWVTNADAAIKIANLDANGDAILKFEDSTARIVYGADSDNDILKFNSRQSGNSDSEAVVIDNNGQVGIGTTSPTYKLEVAGNMSVAGFVNMSANVSLGTGVLFVDNTSSRVGIGTTSPDNLLHIKANPTLDPAFIVQESTAGGEFIRLGAGTGGTTLDFSDTGFLRIAKDDGVSIGDINSGTTELLRITSGGNVGIGTTSPQYLLQVASGTDGRSVNLSNVLYVNGSSRNIGIGYTGMSIEERNTGTDHEPVITLERSGGTSSQRGPAIEFSWDSDATPQSAEIGNLRYYSGTSNDQVAALIVENDGGTNSSNFLFFTKENNSAITQRLTIKSNGSVGIGDSTPDFNLEIVNSSTNGAFAISSAADNDGDLFVVDESGNVGIGTSSPATFLEIEGNTPKIILDDNAGGATDDFAISNGGSFAAFRDETSNIDIMALVLTGSNEGNVGIGTTSPGMKLVVAGNVNISQNLTVNNSVFFVDGTSGNVGIGTTSPDSELDITSGSAASDVLTINPSTGSGQYRIREESGGTFFVQMEDGSGSANIQFAHHAASWINTGQNFGIGTTTPLRKLSVTDSAGVLALFNSTATAGALFDLKSEVGTSVAYRVQGSNEWTFGNDYTLDGSFVIADGNSHLSILANSTKRFVIDSSGNVGIGTTSPAAALTVIGEINGSGLNISGGASIGGNVAIGRASTLSSATNLHVNDGVVIFGDGAGTNQNLRFLSDSSSISYIQAGASSSDTDADLRIARYSTATTNIDDFDIYADETYFSGNVGIGTANPESKLTVAGQVNITNSGEYILIGSDTNNPSIELRDTDSDGGNPFIDFNRGGGGLS